jgi:hypothetical protein
MAADYHDESRSHPPEYRTRSGSSNSWLLALAAAALLGLLAFFTFSGAEQPDTLSTAPQSQPETVAPAPALPTPAPAPAQ